MKTKKLDDLMRVVSEEYDSDGTVWNYYKHPQKDFGDTLAKFIALECVEVSEGRDNKRECMRNAMAVASSGLIRVQSALEELE